jgi:hypothetical protein
VLRISEGQPKDLAEARVAYPMTAFEFGCLADGDIPLSAESTLGSTRARSEWGVI